MIIKMHGNVPQFVKKVEITATAKWGPTVVPSSISRVNTIFLEE
jgi:hypothetical protein